MEAIEGNMNRTEHLKNLMGKMGWSLDDVSRILSSNPKPATVRGWLYGRPKVIPADSYQALRLYALLKL